MSTVLDPDLTCSVQRVHKAIDAPALSAQALSVLLQPLVAHRPQARPLALNLLLESRLLLLLPLGYFKPNTRIRPHPPSAQDPSVYSPENQ